MSNLYSLSVQKKRETRKCRTKEKDEKKEKNVYLYKKLKKI